MSTADHESEPVRAGGDLLPLETARATFALLTAGPCPLSLDGRRFPGLPDRILALDEVRDLLLDRACAEDVRDAVWAHLVLRSRTEGGVWTIGCVGMALPALAATAG